MLAVSAIVGSCSVAAYAPVVGMSAAGLDRNSLKGDEKYDQVIGRRVRLENLGEIVWTLRRFTGGRYFVERTISANNSTLFVCSLGGREIEISDIFEDKINGGIYYSARVQCDGGTPIEAPKNHWHKTLLNSSIS